MDKGQYWQARDTWLCNGCGAPKPGTEKIDIILQNTELGPVPLNMISGTGLGIGRRPFFEELGWRGVSRDLWLGAVHRDDGKLCEDWVSYHGRHPIIVRGKELASYRVCRECSRVVYFAKDDSYLCPPPPSSVDVFDAGNSLLVVSDRLFDLSSIKPLWHGLKVSELPVLETPLDGFDEIVSPYLTSGTSKGR
jgi:hypothetical protein